MQQLRVWAKVPPAVVQRNSDIFSADVVAQSFSGANGWVYEAYSSLGSQWMMKGYRENPVLSHPVVKAGLGGSCSPTRSSRLE